MSAFTVAIDDLFADPNVARDATYTPGGGVASTVKVIPRRPDQLVGVIGQDVVTATALFDVRVSEVASPRPGDTITLDGVTYVVQGEPRRDALRLLWTLETTEQ